VGLTVGVLGMFLVFGTLGVGCGQRPSARTEARERPASGQVQLAPVARVEATDTWQDLIAQRPSAVVMREGRVWIDLGHPSAQKHLQLAAAGSHWRLAQDVDERRAAVLIGRGGSLSIPLDGALSPKLHPDLATAVSVPSEDVSVPSEDVSVPGEDVSVLGEDPPPPEAGLAMAITMRALAPNQSVTVLWEERPLANLRVGETWERRTLSLPADLVVTGENRLRLHFRELGPWPPDSDAAEQAAAAVESVEIGTLEAIRAGPPSQRDYAVRAEGEQVEFEVPAGMSLVYYLVPPRRGRLEFEVSGRGSLEVLASTDADHRAGRQPAELLQQPLRATGRRATVDLSGYGELPTRLEIRIGSSREQRPGELPGGAIFEAMNIVAHRSIPVDHRDRRPRNVYILALEGVRPDDLFEARRRGPRFENVEAFVESALVFEQAYALGAAAVPSHAGALSSVVPAGHLTVRGTFVAEGQVMLAEVFDRAGYFTSNVSANSYFNEERGLTQGFADHEVLRRSNTRGNDAQKVVRAMLGEIEQRPEPRFIYAVLSDAQAPYDPPSEVLSEVPVPEGAPAQHRTHMWVGRVRTGKIEPDSTQLEYVRRLYLGELQVIDAALGELMRALEAEGNLDEAVIVLMGIHGEEFLEHGSAGHGRTLYEESVHVPLAIRAPELLAPGRVGAPVDLLDLAPTLADLLGVGFDPKWQGESLVPLIDDPQPPPRLVVSYLGDGSRAGRIGDYKFVLGPGRGRESQHYYDLSADPGELDDAIAEGGVALRMLRSALGWEVLEQPRWSRPRWGTGANLQPAFALDHGL